MAQYTSLDQDNLETILGAYELGTLTNFLPLDGGQANSSTIISTEKGKYIVSVCDEKSFEELSLLTRTLEYLEKYDIATTQLIKTRGNKPYSSYNDKPVYIKTFIKGNVPDVLTPSMARQIGETLAKLHAVKPQVNLPPVFAYGIESFGEVNLKDGPFPRWLQEKTHYLHRHIYPELPKGLVHGDLFYDNILFEDGRLAALLDFEEVCNYYLIFDLGMCVAGCCCPGEKLSGELARALVAGYQSVRELSRPEQEVFKFHIEYGATATAFWRYRQYNIRFPDIGKNETYQQMSNLANNIAALSTETFAGTVFPDR